MAGKYSFAIIVWIGLMGMAPGSARSAIEFQQGSIFGVGLRASTIDTGDLDGDGDLDLAIANIYSDSITLAYNDGNGNFTKTVEIPLDSGRKHPVALAIGDIDGAGNLDMAVAFVQNLDQTSLSTSYQSGIVLFYADTPGEYIQILQNIDGVPSNVQIADLDGDGDNEILVSNNGQLSLDSITGGLLTTEAGFYYFDNRGRGLFSSGTTIYTDGALVDLQCYDFNADGKNDIVGANQGYTDFDSNFSFIYKDMNISIFRGSDAGVTEWDPYYIDFFPWSLDLGDFNQDGNIDIAVSNVGDLDSLTNFLGTNASVNIFENKGNRFSPLASIPTTGITYAVLAADFDLDGDTDVAATVEDLVTIGGAVQANGSLHFFENDGAGNFIEAGSYTLEEEPRYAVKGDFDQDGDTDIAVLCTIVDTAGVSNAINGRVYVFYNDTKTAVPDWCLY